MRQFIQLRRYCRFRYTTTIREAFLQQGIASLENLDNLGWVEGSDANVFVSNHDTERVRHHCQMMFLFSSITPARVVELYLPQRVFAFKHVHVGYRLLPVRSSFALLRELFLTTDSLGAQRSSLRHAFRTVELQRFLQHRRRRTERRYGLCFLASSSPYTNSSGF